MQRKQLFGRMLCALGITLFAGCQSQQPVTMAPPMNNMAPPVNNMNTMAPPMNQGQQSAGVYQWQEVPRGQQVPIIRATFDQGGYQIFAQTGETIVVPFNQNLYAMKFGRTSGQSYFVNNGDAPILYLAPGSYLENAAAQNARWYPIPDNYASYNGPMYVGLAPSWNEYTAMGWYPGMNYYGGMWSYNPYGFHWMPGFYISIGGARYTDWTGYHTYYTRTPGYVRTTTIYRNYNTPRGSYGSFGSTRVTSSTGFNGGAARSTGSFGGGRSTFSAPRSSSFGGGTPPRSSFGNGGATTPFGGGRSTNSSFGNSTPRSSFGGGTRSSGGSFGGGGRSSFGGGRRR